MKKEKKERTKKSPRFVSFLKGMLVGILIGAVLAVGGIIAWNQFHKPNYTAEIQDAIILKIEEKCNLIVMDAEASDVAIISSNVTGKLLEKKLMITYYGNGQYTTDLGGMGKEDIVVDNEAKKVTITVPKAIMSGIVWNRDKAEIRDVSDSILSFLPIVQVKLSPEDYETIEKEVEAKVREALTTDEMMARADEMTKTSCWQLFQPVISAIAPDYLVEIITK